MICGLKIYFFKKKTVVVGAVGVATYKYFYGDQFSFGKEKSRFNYNKVLKKKINQQSKKILKWIIFFFKKKNSGKKSWW